MPEPQQQLTKSDASHLIQSHCIEELNGDQLIELFQVEEEIRQYIPEDYGAIDPRSNTRILFNPSRAARPNSDTLKNTPLDCPICAGKTTQILDNTELSNGFTFINKNLFPAIYPHFSSQSVESSIIRFPAWGVHLLQWTSSFHNRDWHNMEIDDLVIVMGRLGAIEKHLLTVFLNHQSDTGEEEASGNNSHVSIIKNGGLGSGGSLEHGHQQIIFSNSLPRRIRENHAFDQKYGQVFSKFMLAENPDSLVIQDFGEAVLLVPYFMRRPYDMLLVMRDTTKKYIHQLSDEELIAASLGWKTAISAIHRVMAQKNLMISYNVITHNGPGAGLYFEFLPKTQTEGGFELIGLSVCQSAPETAAAQLRNLIQST